MAKQKSRNVHTFFCIIMEEQGREIINTFTFPQDDQDKVDPLLQKFDDYCKPKKNTIMARFRFNSRVQAPGESIDQFVTDLRILAKECDFSTLCDGLICDRLVCGTNDPQIQEKLLQEPGH